MSAELTSRRSLVRSAHRPSGETAANRPDRAQGAAAGDGGNRPGMQAGMQATVSRDGRCDACPTTGPVRHTGARWLCAPCWEARFPPTTPTQEDTR